MCDLFHTFKNQWFKRILIISLTNKLHLLFHEFSLNRHFIISWFRFRKNINHVTLNVKYYKLTEYYVVVSKSSMQTN